jgi:hypothetical protein
MTIRPFLYFTALLLTQSIYGQLSLTSPLICHDKKNYLRCYNDGNYILTFGKGNFTEFKTSDNNLKYSDVDKTITFLQSRFDSSSIIDTIQIIQLPKSIFLKKGRASLEITSLIETPKEINDYGLGEYSIDNFVRGFTFWSGDRYIKIEIWTYGKTWSWNIIVRENTNVLALDFNAVRQNRLQHIFIQDDSLRYGIALSTTFKSLKKLSHLQSSYVDTIRTLDNGTPVIGAIPLDKKYSYEYDKTGKLITKKTIGELKLCECN